MSVSRLVHRLMDLVADFAAPTALASPVFGSCCRLCRTHETLPCLDDSHRVRPPILRLWRRLQATDNRDFECRKVLEKEPLMAPAEAVDFIAVVGEDTVSFQVACGKRKKVRREC